MLEFDVTYVSLNGTKMREVVLKGIVAKDIPHAYEVARDEYIEPWCGVTFTAYTITKVALAEARR